MSYKDNKYFKKYCNKHKDIKLAIRDLETFCTEETCEMEIYGSLARNDFYYGQSDGDVMIICNNVDKVSTRFTNFIYMNSNMKYKKKKIAYIENKKIANSCQCKILHIVEMNGYNFDVSVVQRGNNEENKHLLPSNNFISLFLMSIVKFLFYKINIIPLSLYVWFKQNLLSKGLDVIKRELHYKENQ